MSSSARRPGLGAVSTRTREEAREEASRIGVDDTRVETGRLPATAAPATLSAPIDDATAGEGSRGFEDPGTAIASTSEPATPAVKAPSRARAGGRSAAPASLRPSRVQLRRVQIGPRLREHVHEEFSEYVHDLANTGLTQSDIVESALIEFMAKYPPDALRAALREDR